MTLENLPARFKAIEYLQSIRDQKLPGSRDFDITDKAIDLTLNSGRTIDEYLTRNVLRDARRSYDREARLHHTFSLNNDLNDSNQYLYDEKTQVKDTPEEFAVANSLFKNISFNKNEKEVLEGLLRGDSAKETSKNSQISASRIAQIRGTLKARILKKTGRGVQPNE